MSSTSSISSLGVGSGLDAESIVTKLVALERQPITDLQTAASKIQTKISAYGKIQSALSTLRDASAKLAGVDLWQTTSATSSDASSASISTSAGAAPGTYAINVSKLATSQSVVSNTALASSSAKPGAGTLTIDLGAWNNTAVPPTFGAKAGSTAVNITVAATDTLDDIRNKINSSGAGISASIINDASGARLVMQSSTTGAANGFRVTATDSDGGHTDSTGLSALAYDPAHATTGTGRTQEGVDASATINGVTVTSASNTLSNVISGITLTLGKQTTSSVNIVVAQDTAAISKAVTDFATSYSSLASLIQSNIKYDDSTKTAGTLQGDTSAVGLQQQLRSLLGSNLGASSVFGNLSSIGLEMQTTGGLTVNTTKLTSALTNTAELKKFFGNTDNTVTANNGMATQLRTLADNMLSVDGTLTTRTNGLSATLKSNQKKQDDVDSRATLYEKRLRAQYTALDTQMAALTSQSNYVTQMITSLNKTA
jgi:flagellar hook-associated protein 2